MLVLTRSFSSFLLEELLDDTDARLPVSFLRAELVRRRHITCAEAMASRDKRWVEVAGVVLVRQRPGSAKGVMFITIEDETGVANLVVWTKVFEANRRTVLGAGMMGVKGRIQREGEVVHLIAHALTDLSKEFASVARRGKAEGVVDATISTGMAPPRMPPAETMSDPYGHVVDEIRVKTRDFR
ncbi:hypothetical protein GCM10011390_22300 [Aureimonas endophytica]|uniref:OB domain-containing protein n=1 Tax=Aureimonas endophytica TaxID=2027858 RepID=A0A916ZL90_9HYPH|nr:OB-fold nucleic acid binding domain-containing protein [Aureimonas endophytica]GGE02984.1 hypothetical protein GCM10011390_22300 [Aureimonas endophytica]